MNLGVGLKSMPLRGIVPKCAEALRSNLVPRPSRTMPATFCGLTYVNELFAFARAGFCHVPPATSRLL